MPLALLLAAAAALAATPPTESDFTAAMAEQIGTQLGREVRIVGPLVLELADPAGGEPATVNLDRVWNVCIGREEEPACEAVTSRFIAALGEVSAGQPPLTSAQLRLMVRSADYCAEARRLFQANGQEPPMMRSGPADLCTLLVADYPTTMRLVRADQLPAPQPSADEAWALAARQTLDNLPDPPTLAFEDGLANVVGHDYTPSLALDDAGWRALAAAQGEIVMAVPEDGQILVARAAEVDPLALRATLRGAVATAFRERPISSNVYRWTSQGWVAIPEQE